jgi:hypothetical protein
MGAVAEGRRDAKRAITQPLIREAAIEMGMVDYKICSVDKTWSGIALTIKKAR